MSLFGLNITTEMLVIDSGKVVQAIYVGFVICACPALSVQQDEADVVLDMTVQSVKSGASIGLVTLVQCDSSFCLALFIHAV